MGEGSNKINFKNNPTILKYVPHRHRATYLNTHDLRSSTPTPYVPQRLAARTSLEARFITFGGSIHDVWRLHSLCLEAPFITFGGSIHYVWRLQTLSCGFYGSSYNRLWDQSCFLRSYASPLSRYPL